MVWVWRGMIACGMAGALADGGPAALVMGWLMLPLAVACFVRGAVEVWRAPAAPSGTGGSRS